MQISSLIGHTQELLGIVFKSDKPADSLIDTFFRLHKYLGSHDRRFIAETSYGTLRNLRKLEYQIETVRSLINCNIPDDERILFLIIAYLSNETTDNQITSDILISKIRDIGTKDNADLVLNNFRKPVVIQSESIVQRIGTEYSFPDWMVEKFIAQYGESETEKICASLNEQAPLTIRVNTLKTSVEQCSEELEKLGIETERTPISPVGLILKKRLNVFSLPIFKEGWFEMQDEGSQILPLLIDPKPNSKLLDVCAGAGGKTLELAAIMKNRGEIFAADVNGFRLEDLRKRAKRAGVQNVRVKEIGSADDLVDRFKGFFDIVLVDAPCSGTGTIRRNPGMKWKITEQTVNEVSEKQKAILNSSAPLVKSGGRLVYATCTLLKQENEDVIISFLERHPEFKLIEPNKNNPVAGSIGYVNNTSYVRLFPHIHKTDGFFCAILTRSGVN